VTLSVEGAAQVLRPPQDGLAYLRHDRAGELKLDRGSLTLDGSRIVALEPDARADVRIDARRCAVLPGLVDCHTHLPFAGWRAEEYERKIAGVPYEEIAREGGGIAASARAFALASDDEILAQARELAGEMLVHGTTTFETKTGYGLSVAGELRALSLAARLAGEVAQTTRSTALLAHAVPERHTTDGWLDQVERMMPSVVESAASALDIYVESVAFDNVHLTRMGELAARHGLALRAHVEQFGTHRSVPVALAAGARSVDHLACMHPDDIAPLAAAECAAVLLPGAEFLGAERIGPGRALADGGAICVAATDCNPGTSPIVSLPVIVGLAVRHYGWTVREALLACTLNAAWVLGLSGELGSVEVGKRADLVLVDAPVAHVPYRFGHNPVWAVVVAGELVYVRRGWEHRIRGLTP
jgi:imidazolonepropionase